MGVGPEKENATNNTSDKMSKKKKNTDDFRLNSLFKTVKKYFFLSQAAKHSLTLQCLVNRHLIAL